MDADSKLQTYSRQQPPPRSGTTTHKEKITYHHSQTATSQFNNVSEACTLIKIPPTTLMPIEIIPGKLDLSSFPKHIPINYTHVLNMTPTQNPASSHSLAESAILQVPLYDLDSMTAHMASIIEFLDSALAMPRSRVLVHCAQGINRSASAVLLYLCHREGYNTNEALKVLRKLKADVNPSRVFLYEIDVYFGRSSGRDPLTTFKERMELRRRGLVPSYDL